ncbi:MAG: aminotransferase class V-fold PLP-dependent enzyme [Halobacteriovoraceae bacterium]|nr:aminotransferase class V-fold PLP-dependent enzyme [Halobacteriovoraceae bacterium]
MIYLDHAASTSINSKAYDVLINFLREDFANPQAAHLPGRNLQKKIEDCRKYFLSTLKADKGLCIFTSSATESNNMVISGWEGKSRENFFYSPSDHPSITIPCEKKKDLMAKKIPLSSGDIKTNALLDSIDDKTRLVILTHINSVNGKINPVFEIAKLIKEKNSSIWIHLDAVQSYGKYPVCTEHMDSVSISSHKIGGPKGIAGLYMKSHPPFNPLLWGGGQEKGWRASTPATSLIFSFTEACRQIFKNMQKNKDHVQKLNEFTKNQLERIPKIRFPFNDTSSYILSFILPGISSDILLRQLEQKNIFLSSTSACSSRIKGKNPVLSALGLEEALHKFVLRISFSPQNTQEEIKIFSEELKKLYEQNYKIFKKK